MKSIRSWPAAELVLTPLTPNALSSDEIQQMVNDVVNEAAAKLFKRLQEMKLDEAWWISVI